MAPSVRVSTGPQDAAEGGAEAPPSVSVLVESRCYLAAALSLEPADTFTP